MGELAFRIRKSSTELARKARREPTPMEDRLWQALRHSRMENLKFRRQAVIEPFCVDFLCPRIGLIVEVDGDTHEADADRDRDLALGKLGYTVLRVTNSDVMTNLEGCVRAIIERARMLPVRPWNLGRGHEGEAGINARDGERAQDDHARKAPPFQGRGWHG